jgi:hypothetical protein
VLHLQRAPPMGYRFPRPQHLSTKGQADQSYLAAMTTLRVYSHLSRVLTFNDAGLRQRSFSGRRFGLCLRGGSRLLSGRRDVLFRHLCSGFIPIPRQVCRFPTVYKLVVNLVRLPHLMYYSWRINTYKLDRTTITVGAPRILAMSTSPASAGASSCTSVAAASSVAAAAGSVPP